MQNCRKIGHILRLRKYKMRAYLIVCLFLFYFALSRAQEAEYASVLLDPLSNRLYIQDDVFEHAVAWGRFSNQVNETGYVDFVPNILCQFA